MAMQLFVPITKVDAAQRLVYGTVAEEIPDKAAEVFDYASSKPYFEAWSKEIAKASDGRSVGNLRAMHGHVAAGKLERLDFDDAAKRIEAVAKVVDDTEWSKVVEGVYTGFSMGGRYVDRWPDDSNPKLTRYTAEPTEVSLVDNPCIPSATFSVVKADGSVETRPFRDRAAARSDGPVAMPCQIWDCGNPHHRHLAKADATKCAKSRARKDLAESADPARDNGEDAQGDSSPDYESYGSTTALWSAIQALKDILDGGDPDDWTNQGGEPLSDDLRSALQDLSAALDAGESAEGSDSDDSSAADDDPMKSIAVGALGKMLARRDALHRAELSRRLMEREAAYAKMLAEWNRALSALKAAHASALESFERRLAALEAQPAEAKGRLLMIEKAHDLGGGGRAEPEIDPTDTIALIKHAQRNPKRIAFG